jgi:hypothetical protein
MIDQIEYWNPGSDHPLIRDKWKLCLGMGVNRANLTLNVIHNTKNLPEDKRKKYIAEAKFLRAFFYFEAWLVFGDRIPLIPEEKVNMAGKISNDNATGEVLDFIIQDLKYASENLPFKQAEPGRATRYAAMALAARACLQELKYAEAKPFLDSIINSNQFQLMPNYFDNYRIEKENNAESVFEIQAAVNDITESLNAEMGIGLNFPHGSDIGLCCGFHQTSQNLANAFKVDANGLPLFDTFNDTDLKNDQGIESSDEFIPAEDLLDPRIDWTIGRRGIPCLDWGIMRGKDWIRSQRDGGPYLPAIKPLFFKSQKFTYSTKTGWMTGVNAKNFRYLRYAHILLWRAEVAAFEGDLATAREHINKVRDRADNELVMGKANVFKLPGSVYPWGISGDVDFTKPAANYNIGLYPPFANKEDAMRAVQWELRLEFATEGMRYFDLRRWDKATVGRVDMAATLNAFARGDERIRNFMKGVVFLERAKYMPIPDEQVKIQRGVLIQNPGY